MLRLSGIARAAQLGVQGFHTVDCSVFRSSCSPPAAQALHSLCGAPEACTPGKASWLAVQQLAPLPVQRAVQHVPARHQQSLADGRRPVQQPPEPAVWTPRVPPQPRPHRRAAQLAAGLDGEVIEPKASHAASLIFLHGMNETASSWADVMRESIAPLQPHLRIVMPTAPLRAIQTLNGMPQHAWYDPAYTAWDSNLGSGGQGFTTASAGEVSGDRVRDEKRQGLAEACAQAKALIDAEVAAGIPHKNIVLAGFSMGGAVAAHTALRSRQRLAGLVGIATYLPGVRAMKRLVAERVAMPLLFCHGAGDDYIHVREGWRAFQTLFAGSPAEADDAAMATLRQMWTYSPPRRRSSLQHYDNKGRPIKRRVDDDEIVSLRSRLSMQDTPDLPAMNRSLGVTGPACVVPGRRTDAGYCLLSGNLSSFVTFPGLGHAVSDEVIGVVADWLGHIARASGWPCKPPQKEED